MPSYAILGETPVEGGKIVKVKLIPAVESEKDWSEVHDYLVKDSELVEDVLSAAAWNHENGVKALIEEPKGGEEVVPTPVDAKAIEELPEELKSNLV